jgi:hypothetical protein
MTNAPYMYKIFPQRTAVSTFFSISNFGHEHADTAPFALNGALSFVTGSESVFLNKCYEQSDVDVTNFFGNI